MNQNNFIDLSAAQFVEILSGKKQEYYMPPTANMLASFMATNQARRAEGLPPEYVIQIPTIWERHKQHWQNNIMSARPKEDWPDFDDPLVYRLKDSVYWDRGMNLSTGEGSKEPLTMSINLRDCEFQDIFSLKSIKSEASLNLSRCILTNTSIYKNLLLDNCSFKQVSLNNLSASRGNQDDQIKEIEIKSLTAEELIISSCAVKKLFIKCSSDTPLKKIKISGGKISELFIVGGELDELELSCVHIEHDLVIDCKIKRFELVGNPVLVYTQPHLFIPKLRLSLSNQLVKGNYLFRQADIRKLYVLGTNNSSILFNDCSISQIEVSYFTNSGEFALHNIRNIYSLTLEDSSMGKAEFLNVALHGCKSTKIVSSNIMDVVLIDTTFSDNVIAKDEKDFKGIRDIFRQLKYSANKHGNRIQELRYESLEMGAYQKDKSLKKTLDDKVILYFNKWTNDFGQSWSKAAGWILFISILAYLLIKLQLGYVFVWSAPKAKDFAQYFEFALNPLHEFGSVFGKEPDLTEEEISRAKLIDFGAKIIIGLLLFQLVKAFRKYVRQE